MATRHSSNTYTRIAADGMPSLSEVIRSHGLKAHKSLGQNFILDFNLMTKIAFSCGKLSGKTIIEIGPGPGGLTRALLNGGAERVIAIERDDRFRLALEEIRTRWPSQFEFKIANALNMQWAKLLKDHKCTKEILIIANLPYNIATRLLISWLNTEIWPPWYAGMSLMFQKEVAERIVAAPGSKAYGRLSIISQWCCKTKVSLTLPPAAFTPPPKVASAIVTFFPRPARLPSCLLNDLEKITNVAFSQRRKMIRTSLKQIISKPEQLLECAGIASNLRAENIDVSAFARLAQAFRNKL